MTTIAYRDGAMAADTQETAGAVMNRGPKLVRLPCGGVAGGAGDSVRLQRALDWLARPKGAPPKLKDAELLVAFGDGRVGYYSDPQWTFIPVLGAYALGSGAQAAMAAMNFYGATAEQAVLAAATVDPNTSAPVDVYRVEQKKRGKRKQ
jgi:hypothetical protein